LDLHDTYDPNPWQTKYHESRSRHKACVGGLGSGKTLAACQEYKQLGLEYPGSRWIIGRKLLPSLKDSIWRDFLAVLPPEIVSSYNKASMNIVLKNGSEFWGRPLYDPEIFKSYQIAGFLIEEANEIDEEIYTRLKDRLRQKLPDGTRPRYTSTILLNPTEDDHWIPQLFVEKKLPNHELFVSTTYDNEKNLPPEYIEELKTIYSEEMQRRLIYGQFGRVHKGRPVYNSFAAEQHMKPVAFDPKLPLIRGWDFGFNHPACVWLQMQEGQVRILAEKMGKRVWLADFARACLEYEKETFGKDFPPHPWSLQVHDFCDPRGADQSDKGKTSIEILNEARIFPQYRRTYIEEGLKAVNECMVTKDPKTGLPNYLIHPRCKLLIEGHRGGYHRIDGEETPEKDGYYEHLQDAHRYAIIFLKMRLKARLMSQAQADMKVHIDRRTGRRIEYRGN
jgi:hypothetical protein